MSAPGRAAVVTGGGRGIGRATAVALAKNGFRVALADIRGHEMQVTAALVREAGSETLALEGDVTSLAAAQRRAAAVLAAWERVDVLVNNVQLVQGPRPRDAGAARRAHRDHVVGERAHSASG